MLGDKIPNGYDVLMAKEVRIVKEYCPKCDSEISLNYENKYCFKCKCGYEWNNGLFGARAFIPLKEAIKY